MEFIDIYVSSTDSAVSNPTKVLSHLLNLPDAVTGKIVAGDPATITVLKYLPKGLFSYRIFSLYIYCIHLISKNNRISNN